MIVTLDGESIKRRANPTRRRFVHRFCVCAVVALLCCACVAFASAPLEAATPGSWKAVASTSPARLNGIVAIAPDDVWAVGTDNSAFSLTARPPVNSKAYSQHWDGSLWSAIPIPNPQDATVMLTAVAGSASNDVWAVGKTRDANGIEQPLIEHWDGTQWSIVPSVQVSRGTSLSAPELSMNAIVTFSSTDAWVFASYFTVEKTIGYLDVPFVLHWDGSVWSKSDFPLPPIEGAYHPIFQSVSARSAIDIWVVGSQTTQVMSGSKVIGEYLRPLTARWDGGRWTIVDAPSRPDRSTFTRGVAVAASDDVWAVGDYEQVSPGRSDPSNEGSQPYVLHWNGMSWQAVTLPDLSYPFIQLTSIVALSPSDVWIAGSIGKRVLIGDVVFHDTDVFFLHWDGAIWEVIATPTPNVKASNPETIISDTPGQMAASSATDLWLIGSFNHANTQTLRYTVP